MRISREQLMENDRIVCFVCGHTYVHLGSGSHPGVCDNCGQRGVSLAGEVDISTVVEVDSFGPRQLLEVYVDDETDRKLIYYLDTVDDGPAQLYTVRLEDTRFTREDSTWCEKLVPDRLREQMEAHEDIANEIEIPGCRYGR